MGSDIKIYYTKGGDKLVKLKPQYIFDLYLPDDYDDIEITVDEIHDMLSNMDSSDLAHIILENIDDHHVVREQDNVRHIEKEYHIKQTQSYSTLQFPRLSIPLTGDELQNEIVQAMKYERSFVKYKLTGEGVNKYLSPEYKKKLNLMGISCYEENNYLCLHWDE